MNGLKTGTLSTMERLMGLLPQQVKFHIVRSILHAERRKPARESVRWLLGLHYQTMRTIDYQCIRWGEGVHIKHKLMTGIHSFFYDRIPEGAYVLDVGCGYGAVAHDIATHVKAYVLGIDINKRHIEFARTHFRHPNLQFEQIDVTKEEIKSVRVDVVVMSSIIEHLPNRVELLQALLCKFQPPLFLIRVPTFEQHYYAALKQELGLFPYTDPTHLLEYSPASFRTEMEKAGLQIQYMELRWGDIWSECVPQSSVATSGVCTNAI